MSKVLLCSVGDECWFRIDLRNGAQRWKVRGECSRWWVRVNEM